MRNGFRFRVLVSAVALAMTTSIAAGAAGVPASAVTLSAPHTVYISVANRYLTMPHRVAAGQYYFQVRTSDTKSVVQIVRPPAGYTPRQFLAAATLWRTTAGNGTNPTAAYTAFVRSVTWVGGAAVTRGGVGAFATGLAAGTYWLYEDTWDFPTHLARIVVLTVVGTPPAQTHATSVGLVRFLSNGRVTLPATLPPAGWLKGLGGLPLNSLAISKLLPGVTQADLDTRGVCFQDVENPSAIGNPSKDCFGAYVELGGTVSAGASVFWYYHLTPGDYITGNRAPGATFERPFFWFSLFTRFTIS